MVSTLLQAYSIDQYYKVQAFGTGLINQTWLVKCQNGENYILQKINHQIFKEPRLIAANIQMAADFLLENVPDYLFPVPIKTKTGGNLIELEGEYFRMFPFVKGSHTVDVVEKPAQAYEASKAFGKFCRLLSEFDAKKLNITLPDFHDLSLRYKQFQDSIKQAGEERLQEATVAIGMIGNHLNLISHYEALKKNKEVKVRVIHHDTKISNVLFDQADKGICVIDLDTLMPGYFISDLGDMLRTYISPAGEEEQDFSKIDVRPAYVKALIAGYLSEMNDILTETEKTALIYSGKFMIYMQALRFITDYLNNDRYYGAKYPEHNLNRGLNQLVLLEKLEVYERGFDSLEQ